LENLPVLPGGKYALPIDYAAYKLEISLLFPLTASMLLLLKKSPLQCFSLAFVQPGRLQLK
jgi:hypothetical protein